MRLYGLLGGQVCICVQSVWQTWGGVWGHAPLGNFDFGPFIRRNLMVFTHKHNLPLIYCVVKAFIKA